MEHLFYETRGDPVVANVGREMEEVIQKTTSITEQQSQQLNPLDNALQGRNTAPKVLCMEY